MSDEFPEWKFPRINPDGTFRVETGFKLSHAKNGDFEESVQRWVNDSWMPNNQFLEREVRTGPELVEKRIDHYSDSFSSPAVIKVKGNRISIILDGVDRKSLWKDWIVYRIMVDLKKEFPEVKDFLFMRDYEEES